MPALPQHHVDSGSSTKFRPGDRRQHLARLVSDLLAVAQMARLVIRDGLRDLRYGHPDSDFGQPLVDVAQLRRPLGGAFRIDRIVVEQVPVILEVRAAAGGIGYDRRAVLSSEAVSTRRPSGLKTALVTWPVWPWKVACECAIGGESTAEGIAASAGNEDFGT
jgi:hypothetical protein